MRLSQCAFYAFVAVGVFMKSVSLVKKGKGNDLCTISFTLNLFGYELKCFPNPLFISTLCYVLVVFFYSFFRQQSAEENMYKMAKDFTL